MEVPKGRELAVRQLAAAVRDMDRNVAADDYLLYAGTRQNNLRSFAESELHRRGTAPCAGTPTRSKRSGITHAERRLIRLDSPARLPGLMGSRLRFTEKIRPTEEEVESAKAAAAPVAFARLLQIVELHQIPARADESKQ